MHTDVGRRVFQAEETASGGPWGGMFKKPLRERCDWNRARKERGRAKGRFFRGPAVVQARESAEDRPVSCTLGALGHQRAMRSKHIGNSTQSAGKGPKGSD